jgi:hypothetical protein
LRAHAVGALVDIDKLSACARLTDCFDGCQECVGDGDDRITTSHAGRHQRKSDGVGAVSHTNTELRAAIGGKLAFEAFDLLSADEGRRTKRLTKRSNKLVLELEMGRDQIEKWNRLARHHGVKGPRPIG